MSPSASNQSRLFTFRSAGWVLLLSGLFTAAIVVLALAGALWRSGPPLVGDGRNVDTYGFDLTTCLVARDQIVAGGLRKDALRALVDPPTILGDDVTGINAKLYGKYLVSADRVIGVTVNGESRAYPIQILNVHEIVNDTLGGVPIAVTYNPLCDSAVVFERHVGGETLQFGVSGLLYNSNLLMYDRRPNAQGESLWSQLLCKAIAGPAAESDRRVRVLHASLVSWADWLSGHPQTTVLDLDVKRFKRYQETRSRYNDYLRSSKLMFPVDPPPPVDGPASKDRVLAVEADGMRQVYTVAEVAERANANGSWTTTLGNSTLRFHYRDDPETVVVTSEDSDAALQVIYAFWFAWHAMWPDDVPAQ